MSKKTTILYDPEMKKSMDYASLRKEGIGYAQKMSGDIWTDYNEHDPGITILEAFCYALTDVAYRTNIAIDQLLFAGKDYQKIAESNALYKSHEIIPCWPFTTDDYRIFLIDKIPEVTNAWVLPVKPSDTQHNVNGLLDVVLKVSSEIKEKDYQRVVESVKKLFSQEFRNLTEDINNVKVLKPLGIEINLNIDIASDAIGEQVLAEIYYNINSYFNPVVKFYTYEELKEEGRDLFDIFETPSFRHGFIKRSELKAHQSKMLIPQINKIIGNVPGVRVVRECILKKNGLRVYGDALEIGDDFFVTLDNVNSDKQSMPSVVVTRSGMNYEHDTELTTHLFDMRLAREKRAYEIKTPGRSDQQGNEIDIESLSKFSSIQNTLPSVYGVGTAGLHGNASQKRIAQAKQLKGYLYFFDQILANHLAQLENIGELFSIKNDEGASYYGKLPINLAPMEGLFEGFSDEMINELLSEYDHFSERKNKVLDHLLARFGEKFDLHLSGHYKSLFGNLDKNKIKSRLIELKVELLKSYKVISRQRAQGINYGKACWSTDDNILPFRKRVYLLLNIKDFRQRSLVDHLSGDNKLSVRKLDVDKVQTRTITGEDKSYLQTNDSSLKFTFLLKGKNAAQKILAYGHISSNYQLAHIDDDGVSVLFQVSKKDPPVKVCEVKTLEEGQNAIRNLIRHFRKRNELSEGFHVVEHILLRPLADKEYGFEVLDEEDNVIFIGEGDFDLETQKQRAKQSLLAACHRSNYEVEMDANQHTIKVRDDDGNTLMSVTGTNTADESVQIKIDEFVEYFKKLDKAIHSVDRKVKFTQVLIKKVNVHKDFYYSKISLILPEWVSRFQSVEFRVLLRSVVAESIPAHISVDFIWMSMSKMEKFESTYKKWLKAKVKETTTRKKQDKLSQEVIALMKTGVYE